MDDQIEDIVFDDDGVKTVETKKKKCTDCFHFGLCIVQTNMFKIITQLDQETNMLDPDVRQTIDQIGNSCNKFHNKQDIIR